MFAYTCPIFQTQFNEKVVAFQLLSCVQLFVTPWFPACQASLSVTISWRSIKLIPIELVLQYNHLILCLHLLILRQSFPAWGSFPKSWLFASSDQKYWSFSLSISASNEYSGLISFKIGKFELLAVQGTQESFLAPKFKSINYLVLSLIYGPTLTSVLDYWKNHSFD